MGKGIEKGRGLKNVVQNIHYGWPYTGKKVMYVHTLVLYCHT